MKGDFSRIRFEPNKHYTDVLDQQGRVAYDADHNEQRFIDGHRRTAQTIDTIGPYGAPMGDAGFAISIVGGNLQIGAGRYYVLGLLCENPDAIYYDQQPFLLDGGDTGNPTFLLEELLRQRDACLCVYLEVWQRMVTALDDDCLGEPALGQADTTVRMQTVWRVVASLLIPKSSSKGTLTNPASENATASSSLTLREAVLQASANMNAVHLKAATPAAATENPAFTDAALGDVSATHQATGCSCAAMYKQLPLAHTGTLCAGLADNGGDCGCQPIPAAGYTGQENQLYRFEIQHTGSLSTATFKWSRENASIVAAVLAVTGNKVTVSSLGMDANLGFQEGQWVEIGDDNDLFGETPNQPGKLYQIQSIDRPSLTVTMTTTVQPVDTARHARMRRWDQSDASAGTAGQPLSDNWIDIENGIRVRFGKGHYFAGDAWVVPARSATGDIDWPPCGSNGDCFQPPHYAMVYRAPLACIHSNNAFNRAALDINESVGNYGGRFKVDDCRRLFPSLTDIGNLANANALHITGISWNNDRAMTFDALIKQGLTVTFDQPPDSPLTPANFIVTFEMPMVAQAEYGTMQNAFALNTLNPSPPAPAASPAPAPAPATPAPAAGVDKNLLKDIQFRLLPTPTTIRSPFIVDSSVAANGNDVVWSLPIQGVSKSQLTELEAIDLALAASARQGLPARVRVKLPGHMLYATTAAGKQLYLDGQVFGITAGSANIAFNEQYVDLQFPSGNDMRASDFESWFYLYPALAVQSVSFTYSQVTVADENGNTVVTSTMPAAATSPVVQQATIALNYSALQATTVQLAMSGDASIASVPASVTVPAGESSVTVDVTLQGVPPNAGTDSFTLTASLPSALGFATSQTASFSVTGTLFFK
ncbi:hypothetical protein ISN76_10460 [Dyella halodurans]|uniref:DUF6519 domain-containing protein n=1 Tax=Dyella halodurans TaxID=1920171 RepID=A0ABV9C2A0_9GAMM|nr:DUF6519 domain-containing protein [Dyella halodurans]